MKNTSSIDRIAAFDVSQNNIAAASIPNIYSLDKTLKAMADIHFVGHIIPHTWKVHIIFENGKPDLLGMMILSDIIYWYRPTIKRCEKTGQILGYQKKFYADKLHYNIKHIAKQNGVSYRQAFDALSRLEKKGLVQKECRIVETSYGSNGNVLYVNPVVNAIHAITQLPKDLPEITTIQNEPEADFISVTPLCNELHKGVISNERPLCNPLQEGMQSITNPSVIDRHITKNTTKIISKNTTAEAEAQCQPDFSFNAAAATNDFNKNISTSSNTRHFIQVEALLGDKLTDNQKTHLVNKLAILSFDETTTQRLAEEIEAGLLDSQCFSKCGNDYHRKLSAILKTLKEGTWTPPASFVSVEEIEKSKVINEEQKALSKLMAQHNKHYGEYNHWKRLCNMLTDKKTPAEITAFGNFAVLWQEAWVNLCVVHEVILQTFPNATIAAIPAEPSNVQEVTHA